MSNAADHSASPASSPERHLPRRTVLAGAAWSLPVIAAATAIPLAAASTTPARQTYTVTVTGAGQMRGESAFTLPADATNIQYSVTGGNGGGSAGWRGGRGALLTGSATPSGVPVLVSLVAAGGGGRAGRTAPNTDALGRGGQGFSAGGSAPTTQTSTAYAKQYANGGGGGGSSAVRFGTDLAVVAAGGGGAGSAAAGVGSDTFSVLREPNGGNAGSAASIAELYTNDGAETRTLKVSGAGGATADTGGVGGAGTSSGYGQANALVGVGNAGGSTSAGDGGDGVPWAFESDSELRIEVAGSGGGGGAGYAGGGSGGYAVGRRTPSFHVAGVCGGGGGGGSFTAERAGGMVLVSTPAGSGLHPATPQPDSNGAVGQATITFDSTPGQTFP